MMLSALGCIDSYRLIPEIGHLYINIHRHAAGGGRFDHN